MTQNPFFEYPKPKRESMYLARFIIVLACAHFSVVISKPTYNECAEVTVDCEACKVEVDTPKSDFCGKIHMATPYASIWWNTEFNGTQPLGTLSLTLNSEVVVRPIVVNPEATVRVNGPGTIKCTGYTTSKDNPWQCKLVPSPINKRSLPAENPTAQALLEKIRGTLAKVKAEDVNVAGAQAKLHDLWYSAEMFPVRSFFEGFSEKLTQLVNENEPQLKSLVKWLGLPLPQEMKETVANFI